jgi:hypothetical protein
MLLAEGKFYLFGKDEIDVSEKITKTNKDILEYGTIATSFWEGILLEDKRVIYNSQGVRAIADVIILVLECIKQLKNDGKMNLTNHTIRYSTQRTKRLLKKRFGNRSDEEFEKMAKQILNIKKQFIIERLGEFIQSK